MRLDQGAPDWMQYETAGEQRTARERLWNTIEKTEKRSDSQLAREFLLVLPVELERGEQCDDRNKPHAAFRHLRFLPQTVR